MDTHPADTQSAFGFSGSWREFLPIALSNLALTIVTLGVYRFWGQVRERKYLWSHSRFIDAPLDWTGTGTELFVGFLMSAVLFGVPFFIINFGVQALALQGYGEIAGLITAAAFILIYFLVGVARFRALRYRLSRTYWRGIRGGSDNPGIQYGWSYIWKNAVGWLPLGLLIPWSMVSLWNERWKQMSFGSHQFDSTADFGGLMKRFLLFYLSPIIFFVVVFIALIVGGIGAAILGIGGAVFGGGAEPAQWVIASLILIVVATFYLILPMIWLIFYAKFYRVVVGSLTLEKLQFSFSASTQNWLLLFLGDFAIWFVASVISLTPIALIVAAFGLLDGIEIPRAGESTVAFEVAMTAGLLALIMIPLTLVGPFLRYRHWAFFMRHMEAYGEIDVGSLTQSDTRVNKHGEGLLDALDVGAF